MSEKGGLDPAAFADLLAGYCLDVDAGEQVLVRSTAQATPLLLELQRAILQRGAWALLRVDLPGQSAGFFTHAQDVHLDDVAPLELHEAKKVHKVLAVQAPDDVHALAGVDPAQIARAARARRPVREATLRKGSRHSKCEGWGAVSWMIRAARFCRRYRSYRQGIGWL